MVDADKTRRLLRGKVMNVLERIEQLDGREEEVNHLDSAIRSLVHFWEDCKRDLKN